MFRLFRSSLQYAAKFWYQRGEPVSMERNVACRPRGKKARVLVSYTFLNVKVETCGRTVSPAASGAHGRAAVMASGVEGRGPNSFTVVVATVDVA